MKPSLTVPSFICIGAQRTGTTWLHKCLKEHPEVFMPEQKELHFFNRHYNPDLQSYGKHFAKASGENIVGEVTPGYYRDEQALFRIKKHIPDVKLIFIVRSPIERAYSQYELYYGADGRQKTFREAYLADETLINWGKYGAYLETIYRIFDRRNVLVLDYDQLKADPAGFLRRVFQFIGVSRDFVPKSLNTRYNKVIYPRTQRFLKLIGLESVVEFIKRTWIGKLIRNHKTRTKQKISSRDRAHLSDWFRDDIEKLSQLVGRDYTHWLHR